MTRELAHKGDKYRTETLEGIDWTRVYKNDSMIAMVVNREEARRVIWLDIDDPDILFVRDDGSKLFVEVTTKN